MTSNPADWSTVRRHLEASPVAKDLAALTATGGRLIGSDSEAAARLWIDGRLRRVPASHVTTFSFPYTAWHSTRASLELLDGATARSIRCHPLYWAGETPTSGTVGPVVDIGRGTQEEFRRRAESIRGAIVIVRHEYPFARQAIHRRIKYNRSRELGAAGFLIANNNPGDLLVTGSCGQDSADNIPAAGISRETVVMLAGLANAKLRLRVAIRRQPSTGINFIAEIPGQTSEWVVVCAHYDGHNLAQSALDNGTGVVAALAVFESIGPVVPMLRRGLRLILFTAEESGLLGSKHYVQSLSQTARDQVAVVINLDTLAGSRQFACLTSEYDELARLAGEAGERVGTTFQCHRPLLRNSDHFNFAQAGIPALRLVAGFDDPSAGARLILTEADRANAVSLAELEKGVIAASSLTWSALTTPETVCGHKPPVIPA